MARILTVGEQKFDMSEIPGDWEVVRVLTEADALSALAARTFDVALVGVQVPGSNGLKLLTAIRDRYPSTVRILVGHAAVVSPSVAFNRVAHDRVSLPIKAAELHKSIERGIRLRKRLTDERLLAVMARTSGLPSFPTLYTQVTQELESDDPSLHRIGAIVSRDPGLTAKILHLVNSPFYGLRREVVDPHLAVGLLGIQSLLSLILSVRIFSQFEASAAGVSVQQLWIDSLAVAASAMKIAETEGASKEEANEAYAAGILHDSGRLILAANFPAEYTSAVANLESGIDISTAEQEAIGTTHAEVGAFLLDSWSLPDRIVEAVAYHHHPTGSTVDEFGPLAAVYVADAIYQGGGDLPDDLDTAFLERIGKADRVDEWVRACNVPVGA